MEGKLKPCPFCDSEVEITFKGVNYNTTDIEMTARFYIKCPICKITSRPYETKIKISKDGIITICSDGVKEAIKDWNNRPNNLIRKHAHWEEYVYDEFTCSYCHSEFDEATPFCPNCGCEMDQEKENEN